MESGSLPNSAIAHSIHQQWTLAESALTEESGPFWKSKFQDDGSRARKWLERPRETITSLVVCHRCATRCVSASRLEFLSSDTLPKAGLLPTV